MTAPDPRVGEECCLGCPDCGPTATKRTVEAIAHRVSNVSEGPWTAWDRGIGYEVHSPEGEPINSGHRETFTKGDAEFIAMAPGDVYFLLAELRKARERARRVAAVATRYRDERNEAHEALARVEELHTPVKVYDECDCPDGAHPDEYDYIDCEDYVGCENSLSGIGCQECCVDSWDSLTQDCGENHSHSKDPAFRCDTIKALRAAVAAANGDGEDA